MFKNFELGEEMNELSFMRSKEIKVFLKFIILHYVL